jgi:hypothetical protein
MMLKGRMKMTDLFAIGATLFTDKGREVKIAKVHKNGNIVLEGDTQQYRPSRGREPMAWETGGGYNQKALYPDTPENRTRFEALAKIGASRLILDTEIKRLQHLHSYASYNAPEINAEAARIQERNKGE